MLCGPSGMMSARRKQIPPKGQECHKKVHGHKTYIQQKPANKAYGISDNITRRKR